MPLVSSFVPGFLLIGLCRVFRAPHLSFPCSFIAFFVFLPQVFGGATGCNWVIVVNADSIHSRTIANHYSHLRDIPARNVIVLNNIPNQDQIHVSEFRDLILSPLLKEIDARGLAPHLQGIAYSSDFPTAIDIQSEIASIENRSPYLTPVASINGLTYLFRFVLQKNPSYIGFNTNNFAARPASQLLLPILASTEKAQELDQLLKSNSHSQAATMLESAIAEIDPALTFPMHYLAAQQWALDVNASKAIPHLEKAIRGGWTYREQILSDKSFLALLDNRDFQRIAKRCKEDPFDYLPTRGFDARTQYAINTLGGSNPKYGISYLLSMVLAVTRDQGNTHEEALKQLTRSVAADATYPRGVFFFTKTADVRTTTRVPAFAQAIDALTKRGKEARIIETAMPSAGEKCGGVMMGTPSFQWAESGAEMLPGCIADNLTSVGGAMTTADQTKATEFLRHGAAASSGTVTEPYTIPNKFPHPMIHAHYVDGLTAAEAFYSSVTCPYQLLIIGDALCQPFCKPPRFSMKLSKESIENEPLMIQLQTKESAQETEAESMQLFLDGVLRSQVAFDPNLRINFNGSDAGAHEVRIVTIASKPIEERFQQSRWIRCGGPDQQLVLTGPKTWKATNESPLSVQISQSPKATEIQVLHDFDLIGVVPQGKKSMDLPLEKLGHGPVRLFAICKTADGKSVQSMPWVVNIEP
jgi:hypothetical protein